MLRLFLKMKVVKQLRNLEAVKEAYVSYGSFDLVLRIKADTREQLKNERLLQSLTLKKSFNGLYCYEYKSIDNAH